MPHTCDRPEDIARLAHDLRLACMRVSRQVRFEATTTIAPHQFSVLARLEAGPHTSGELAGIERVSPPSMSRTVGTLADLGLVERSPDPDDGRVVRLALTEEGRGVLARNRADRDAWMAARLAGLDSDERRVLRAATDLLQGVIDR